MEQEQEWRVALIQANIALGEPKLNREHLEAMMEEAASAELKPDVIVMPEMWNTGYALQCLAELADYEGEETRAWISSFAHRHRIHVVAGSISERKGKSVQNVMHIFDHQGREVGEYAKIHLFRLMQEEQYLTSGDRALTFELGGIRSAAAICYDIRFPELIRGLALKGAKVLFVPAQWPHPRLNHWRTLLMARAIENQMYVIACNRVGMGGDARFFGHSMIIDPWGEVIAEGGESEAIISASISCKIVDQIRKQIPVFQDRRPDLYP